jgi:acylphosphatase
MSDKAKNIIFTGQVQGVGFRFTAFNIANRFHLSGMVRNLPQGSVEMLVQGDPDNIGLCINEIMNSFQGYIKDAKINEIPVNPSYTDFRITF